MIENEDEDEDVCADCLEPMGEDGTSCHCYCADCGEWNGDCTCEDEDEDED